MNQDTFIDYLKTNGWEMRKGKKYNPFILHRNLKEFNYPLFVCVDKHIAKQYIDNPNGQELWGELDFTDYTLNDLKENKQLDRCNPCVF